MKNLTSWFFIIGSFCWLISCRSQDSAQKNLSDKSFEMPILLKDAGKKEKDKSSIHSEEADVIIDTAIVNALNAKILAQAKKREDVKKKYSLLVNGFKNSSDGFLKDSNYPDFFGGAYIDETDRLIVYIKGDSVKRRKIIESIVKDNDFVLKQGRYSYKTLLNLRDKILFLRAEKTNTAIADNIMSCHVEKRDNCVHVVLMDCSEKRIEEFKKNIINSSAIRFIKYEGPAFIINDDVL